MFSLLSSQSFIVLAPMFIFLFIYIYIYEIQFELIFVYGVTLGPTSFFSCGYRVYPTPFIQKTVPSPLNGLRTALVENHLTTGVCL